MYKKTAAATYVATMQEAHAKKSKRNDSNVPCGLFNMCVNFKPGKGCLKRKPNSLDLDFCHTCNKHFCSVSNVDSARYPDACIIHHGAFNKPCGQRREAALSSTEPTPDVMMLPPSAQSLPAELMVRLWFP